MKKLTLSVILGLVVIVLLAPLAARADSNLYVGYADGIRGCCFFPNPWQSDSSVSLFVGGGSMDAGAIRIQNSGSTDITINSLSVLLPNSPGSFSTYDANIGTAWAASLPFVLHPGDNAIFTQLFSYDFDTSDAPFLTAGSFVDAAHPFGGCTNPTAVAAFYGFDLCAANAPRVTVTIDGISTTLTDSGHVLDTFGYDLASLGNESIGWHNIGSPVTTRENDVPEPSSILLLGSGLAGLAGVVRRKLLG